MRTCSCSLAGTKYCDNCSNALSRSLSDSQSRETYIVVDNSPFNKKMYVKKRNEKKKNRNPKKGVSFL